jgi:enterochelin esterase family protein
MSERGSIVVETIDSPALRGNRQGDPAQRATPVYLPPSYGRDQMRRYPTIYWLPGFTGTGLGALSYDPWLPSIPESMDRAIADGAPEAIVVIVDGFTRFGGSQYLNSAANGQYEDYVVEDVVGQVDARFRTVPRPEARGIAGKSSGGYGAFVLAMRHPETFGAVSSHSGDAYFELCYKSDFPKLLNAAARHGHDVDAFLSAFLALEKKTGDAVAAASIAAMAMAYSPNPNRPPYFYDLPFDSYTGELDPTVWERWQLWDPVNLVAHYADALRSLRILFFECGTRDEYQLQYGARILARRLDALRVPYRHEEFDDTHSRTNYRYPAGLARLSHALAGER